MEQLAGAPARAYASYRVSTCSRLRKKPLRDFEDLRIMIGQGLMPLAAGNFYPPESRSGRAFGLLEGVS